MDFVNLSQDNVHYINHKPWLKIKRQKTKTTAEIPLLDQAMSLIQKYRNHPLAQENERLFPRISNQRLNAYLKEIADICGIKRNLTFHLARYTFATTITLSQGVPIESISQMLGHTKITTTQIYASVLEDKLGRDMEQVQGRIGATFGKAS
ncbi:integrase catalytic domain-containing protein [Fulvivirga sp. 2943]|uniref:Integrase catalytic domain-containing protein n=1 Tax=Fulvivirga sediminis TaxID=2803949 RepID=A0A937F9N5_9BACT|nr:integrase catalytic domain-containing protein [Fulvivirga sediminis]